MDSVTQFVLGAAVGEAVIGRQAGRKAILWGGLAGTLPDLDVYIQTGDAVALEGADIVINDLRMGVEPGYVFAFKVAEQSNPHVKPVVPVRITTLRDLGLLEVVWQRIWDDSVKIGYLDRPQH